MFNHSFHLHLKWKLEEQLAKDQPEIIRCEQDCGENQIFTAYLHVHVLRWIALDASANETWGIYFC